MKKKRRFNAKKFAKTWSVIGVIIIIIVLIMKRKSNEIVSSTDIVENVNSVSVESPEINSKVTEWSLILVNKDNKIPEDYQYELETVENTQKVDKRIVEPLTRMLEDARKEGLKPLICSSYRTTNIQTTLFNRKVGEYKTKGYDER